MWRIALGLIYATVGAFARPSVDGELYFSFMKYGIQPDIIPFCPLARLSVEFVSGAQTNLGNAIDPEDFKGPPAEILYDSQRDIVYTLAYIDTGVPKRIDNTSKPFLQWLVVNIPGSDVQKGNVVSSYVESPYRNQLVKGYSHRFLILVYPQPHVIEKDEMEFLKSSLGDREGFSVADFLFNFGMTIPAFGNFYLANAGTIKNAALTSPSPLKSYHFEDRNSMVPNSDAENSVEEDPAYSYN